jgi:hypothetical protein
VIPSDHTIDLSIIIVSWNVADLLDACLRSIAASPAHDYTFETIVVDSASGDDTVARVRRDHTGVTSLPQRENLGYTRCNNIGLAAARGRHLLLLNPDTEIIGDALAQMVAYLDAHPEVGFVGPHTLNTDGSTQSSRRRFPTRPLAFLESTWLQPLAPRALLDAYYTVGPADDAIIPVDWMQGSALMARREVYAQIGGLDERYVMFYEELDWCRRGRMAGWGATYLGTAQIIHHGGKSTEQVGARKHIYFNESKLRYFGTYYGRGFALALRLFLLSSFSWQVAKEALRWLMGSQRAMRRQRVDTYLQVLRSGLRPRLD